MATATAAKKTDERSPSDYLQGALDDLVKARDNASEDIRAGIESAIKQTRAAIKEARSEAEDQVSEWQKSLEKATDDVRRELGLMAVRAQRTPEALREMSAEIRRRKTELTA